MGSLNLQVSVDRWFKRGACKPLPGVAANVDPAQASEVLVLPIRDAEMVRPAGIATRANLPLTHAASALNKRVI